MAQTIKKTHTKTKNLEFQYPFFKNSWSLVSYQKLMEMHLYILPTLSQISNRDEINMRVFNPSASSHPVHSVRTCCRIIYMFVCPPTSCLGVVSVDIDQNHQLWWSPPGSAVNGVPACQLNPGQRQEADISLNAAASSHGGSGGGLTPGLTAPPSRKATRRQTWGGKK